MFFNQCTVVSKEDFPLVIIGNKADLISNR